MADLSEYRWEDVGGGLAWEFVDDTGERLAEVSRGANGLWRWLVLVPERYRTGTVDDPPLMYPEGYVRRESGAKHVCEVILRHTILDGD